MGIFTAFTVSTESVLIIFTKNSILATDLHYGAVTASTVKTASMKYEKSSFVVRSIQRRKLFSPDR
jgi:hypothetical protein